MYIIDLFIAIQPHKDIITEKIYKYSRTNFPFDLLNSLDLLNENKISDIDKTTYISKTAKIEQGVYIGKNCKIYDNALVRKGSIILDNVIIGHCSEVSHSVVFSNTNITHKVSIADSVIGHNCNLGANVVLSNISFLNKDMRNPNLNIKINNANISLQKFGSLIGDNTRIGMNSSLDSGCIIGKNSLIYPNTYVRSGEYINNSLIKASGKNIIKTHRQL